MKVITTHINADFDTLGSMVAAKKLYKDAKIIFPGSLQKNLRTALTTIKDTIDVVELSSINLDDISTLILVDIKTPARIGKFKDILNKTNLKIEIYDHHPVSDNDIKGTKETIFPYGSTTTILTLLIKKNELKITPIEATIMLAGIYEDTGRLSYPSTTKEDFEAATFLFESGAVLNDVNEYLREDLTKGDIALLSDLTDNLESYRINGIDVAITVSTKGNLTEDFSPLVQKLRDAIETKSLFAIIEKGARLTLIGRSSIKEVNAGLILKELGGGGHSEAASCAIKNFSLSESKELLLGSIKKHTVSKESANLIMTTPAISVAPMDNLNFAKKILSRYNINSLVVLKDNALAGIITGQTLDKAIYHGLGSQKVGDYMTIDFATVKTTTSIDDVREKVLVIGQRMLPVTKGKKTVGVITRADLLKILNDELKSKDIKLGKQRNIKSLLNEGLPEWSLDILHEAGKIAEKLNYKAYIVGGIVRDILLRKKNLDLDIVIEGDGIKFAKEFARIYSQNFDKPIKVMDHKRFQTAVLIFPDGFKMDIATARLEYYENPGALPTVELSSLKLDLYRRDFTINSMAVCINEYDKFDKTHQSDDFGHLIDYFGGTQDLKEKKIRVLHNLSFVEDPTRVLRAVRLCVRYGFTLTKHTENLIKNTVKVKNIQDLILFRMGLELKSILEEPKAVSSIKMLNDLNMLQLIDENIKWTRTREVLFYKAKEVVSWYHLLYTDKKIDEWFVLFLVLTMDLNESHLKKLAKKLSIEGRGKTRLINQRALAIEALNFLKGKRQPSNSEVYLALKGLSPELILFIMAYTKREGLKKAISHYITDLKDIKPFTTGTELKTLGIAAGPKMGKILEELLMLRIDGKIKSKKEEKTYLKNLVK